MAKLNGGAGDNPPADCYN
ncbi:unknown protein [Parachlamydia acanthamoebae UV-7]|uniref:Uncharacterized protein n=1 Tax=Parachlamydia acanthamoebae (strain UV7) TaxID=765952 RepID=F8L231_PARAV|nr:unknown protein [Parachlamydia acanthamoebae UV-7]